MKKTTPFLAALALLSVLPACYASCRALFPVATSTQTTPPVVPPAAKPKKPLSTLDRTATDFFARYPSLPATGSWIGNSNGGTTEKATIWGRTKKFPDGAPIRLAAPPNADRVGLEWGPDGKTVLIRVHSYWNEGGWQDTYFLPDGTIVGGMQDVGFPRQDTKNKTAANAWQFGTGYFVDGAWDKVGTTHEFRTGVPFVKLKPGPDSGYLGYTWRSDDGGFVMKTPKTTIYGLIGFGTVVTDPANPNLVFSSHNAHTLDWMKRGGGREQVSFARTFDYTKYPTDPRRTPAAITHPGPLAAVRIGGELYVYTAENEVMLHRWNPVTKLLVPVASLYVRPDELPASMPGHPKITWGQGAVARAGVDGNFTADKWQVFDTKIHGQRGSSFVYDVDAAGNLYFLPKWSRGSQDANPIALWKTFDSKHGVFSPDNVTRLPLPDALKAAPACESVRIDWASGDLVAVVSRDGKWMLERYTGWRNAVDPSSLKPAYSVGPVALNIRTQFPPYARYNAKWGASVNPDDPNATLPTTGFATMVVSGGYVFLAEVQGGGVHVHRLSDGTIAGRVWSRDYQNSSMDNPTQMQVTQTASEFRIFLVDFNGKACLVWRISKSSLAVGVKKAQ